MTEEEEGIIHAVEEDEEEDEFSNLFDSPEVNCVKDIDAFYDTNQDSQE